MWKFLPYILKNLSGHRVRTVMTVGGTALLMFLFLFVTSIQEGLDQLLQSSDERLIVFQAYRFCPSSSQLPEYSHGIPNRHTRRLRYRRAAEPTRERPL